jgi:hypothetical protein
MNNYNKIGAAAWLFCASLMITLPVQAFDCANLPQWDSTAVYVGGQEAQFGSDAYRAKWWTQNQNPIRHNTTFGRHWVAAAMTLQINRRWPTLTVRIKAVRARKLDFQVRALWIQMAASPVSHGILAMAR